MVQEAVVKPNEKLAAALEHLRSLQEDGSRVFATDQFTRTTRERLVASGWLVEPIQGWLTSSSPSARPGDTTPWFSSFWEFLRKYCAKRFGEDWHLSPEHSLYLHAESTVIPKQVIVHSSRGNNGTVALPHDTSLFALRTKEPAKRGEVEVRQGIRVLRPSVALVRVSQSFFENSPTDARVVLQMIRDPSGLLERLLAGGHSVVAGRLAGAFRHLGKDDVADELLEAMKTAGYPSRETNPFLGETQPMRATRSARQPLALRLEELWRASRETVLQEMPRAPGLPKRATAYLQAVDDIYALDAYHSLSIEGYQVTTALIEQVANGRWHPTGDASDREHMNALAARGYWLAFKKVREVVELVISGGKGPDVVRKNHRAWYRQLFAPHVAAGVLQEKLLAGHRTQPVFLKGSRHVPPRWESVVDGMETLFDLIESEPDAGVRAVLGHWLIGLVHPFPDGNGRLARFAMNTLLAGSGHPWTVIRVEDRQRYLDALEAASVSRDIVPFARFIATQVAAANSREPRKSKPASKT